jgi:sugar lactone lactonase YvrE
VDRFETLVEGLDHPEGVAWGTDGRVYAGGEAGQIYAVTLDGNLDELASTGGFIYGVTLDGLCNVYACDFGNASIARIDASGEISTYSAGTRERPMQVPNFSAFDAAGNLYVTDSGNWGEDDGVLFRISPGGETIVWTQEVPGFPNGCCLSLEGDALLVVESRPRRIVRISISDDGSAGPVEPLVEFTDAMPDGVALAEDGTMFVGTYRPDRIYRVPPGGAPEVWADDPDGVVLNQPANVAFIGRAMDRLVVSSLGGWNLVIADAGAVGAPLHRPVIDLGPRS